MSEYEGKSMTLETMREAMHNINKAAEMPPEPLVHLLSYDMHKLGEDLIGKAMEFGLEQTQDWDKFLANLQILLRVGAVNKTTKVSDVLRFKI